MKNHHYDKTYIVISDHKQSTRVRKGEGLLQRLRILETKNV